VTTDEVTKRKGDDFTGDTFNTDPKSSGATRAQQGSSLGSNRAFSSLAYLALLAFIFWWRTMRKPHKVSAYGVLPLISRQIVLVLIFVLKIQQPSTTTRTTTILETRTKSLFRSHGEA